MPALLATLLDIVRCRRGPEDPPPSGVLAGRVLMLAIEGSMLTGFAFTMMMILSIIYVGQLLTPVSG